MLPDRFDGAVETIGRRGVVAGVIASIAGGVPNLVGASVGLCRRIVRLECSAAFPTNPEERAKCKRTLRPCCRKTQASTKKAARCFETMRRSQCVDLAMDACAGDTSDTWESCMDWYTPCCQARGTLPDKLACNGWLEETSSNTS
jgi:hypothetical protein